MRMHAEALFTHDADGRIDRVNVAGFERASRFFLGRTAGGNLWRFRSDLPDDVVLALEDLCRDEPVVDPPPRLPLHEDAYVALLEDLAPVKSVGSGPAWLYAGGAEPDVEPVAIDQRNSDLLRGGLEDWLADVKAGCPLYASIADDHAVSVCGSVRITAEAHEAGVETLPDWRRQGHAANAVAGWARAIRKTGVIPLYSTSWDNIASQGVAARTGLTPIGADFFVD